MPHVNGELFEASLHIPTLDASMREKRLAARRSDWSILSPAIFGALFHSAMDPAQRRNHGPPYTRL